MPSFAHLETLFQPGTPGVPSLGSDEFWVWYANTFKPDTWLGPVPTFKGLSNVIAYARVDHGRWIVDCPFCPGAARAGWREARFICAECFHVGTEAEGKFIRVEWPPNVEEIETVLEARPPQRRNWWPTEEISKLRAENYAYPELERRRMLERGRGPS